MAQLSDSVAQQIMGEIDDLVKRIEAVSEKVPQTEALQIAVNNVLKEFKTTAGMTVMGETARMKAELTRAAIDVAEKVAKDVAGRERAEWIAGCIAVAFLTFCLFGLLMHHKGRSAGYSEGHEQGYIEAKDEKAAASWANTPEGELAYGLAQAGSIRKLAHCDGKGWIIKNNSCFPQTGSDNMIYGWRIKP
jgi:hypothetical protein